MAVDTVEVGTKGASSQTYDSWEEAWKQPLLWIPSILRG